MSQFDGSALDPAAFSAALSRGERVDEAFASSLCDRVADLLAREPNVLTLQSPLTVVGDVHGQLLDVLKLLRESGQVWDGARYLFLGDYVDRGFSSVETFCLIALLKVLHPDRVFLLRGNHESRRVNQMYGLLNDCMQLYGHAGLWLRLNEVFDLLPVAAVVDGSIFCVHGGLSPEIARVGRISTDIYRRQEIPVSGPFADLCWSDPDDVAHFVPSTRGAGFLFGRGEAEAFLRLNKLDMIARSHQLAMEGYNWHFDKKVVTVWSAPNYMYRSNNKAAVMKIEKPGAEPTFQMFTEDERSSEKPNDDIVSYFV